MIHCNPRMALIWPLATATLATLISATAIAQSDESGAESRSGLEEIRVTARKRDEILQDIPTSASALTRDFLDSMLPVQDMRTLTDLVPGITMNDVNLHFISEPSIRGGGAGRNRMSASATGLYRNGAYMASAGPGGKNFARMDYFDMERAEILRGPQGALYGGDSIGGVIGIYSNKGEGAHSGGLRLEGGSFNSWNTMLGLQGSEGDFSYSLGLGYETTENDLDHNDFDSLSGTELMIMCI